MTFSQNQSPDQPVYKVYKSYPRVDLSNYPLDKNNPSLTSRPLYTRYSASPSKAWSVFRFLGRDSKGRFQTYQLWIRFHFTQDSRGLLRAFRKNGWLRGDGICLFHLDGSPLSPELEKKNRLILIARLKNLLSRHTLEDVVIFRYQITIMCYSMYGYQLPTDRRGWVHDTHHKSGLSLLRTTGQYSLSAIDDRKDNLVICDRTYHKELHNKHGDTHFVSFNSTDLLLFKFYFNYSLVFSRQFWQSR